ncbi:MAG: glycosyl transferase family 2 [Devosia sp.]|nr:glycosyl transferase family 2 [Devosia sp.]
MEGSKTISNADVTICVPAYNSAAFIDRTLRCAQGQTHSNIRILVSVDRSSDETVEICRTFAREDARIEVLVQNDRLGWCGNVNALIDRVDTEYFFVYFHDDLIMPQYCSHMLMALTHDTELASANCDLFDFGLKEGLRPGRSYHGSVAKRLLTLWGVEGRGTPLRSMVRTERIGKDYRLPKEDRNSFTPGQTLLMRLVAAGPAQRVPETLYLRWRRSGGLTGGWAALPIETVLEGLRRDLQDVFATVDELIESSPDKEVIKLAAILNALRTIAGRCRTENVLLPEPRDLHPAAPELVLPLALDRFGTEIAGTLARHLESVARHRVRP